MVALFGAVCTGGKYPFDHSSFAHHPANFRGVDKEEITPTDLESAL